MKLSFFKLFLILFAMTSFLLSGCPDSGSSTDGDLDGDVSEADQDIDDTDGDFDTDKVIDGDEDEDAIDVEKETSESEDETGKATIKVQPELQFPVGVLNTTISETLKLENIGTNTLVVNNIHFDENCTEEFSIATQVADGIEISPDSSEMIVLNYRMADSGVDTCYLSILSNDPDNSEVIVTVTTTDHGNPDLHIYPATLEFDDHDIYQTEPTTATFKLTHILKPGSSDILHLKNFTFESDNTPFSFPADFDPETEILVSPGNNVEIPVNFKPDALGSYTNKIFFETNSLLSGDSIPTVNLEGKGVAAQMNASTTSVEFNLKPVGYSHDINITLDNEGEADAYIDSISFSDNANQKFSFTTNWVFGTPIKPGNNINITISYTPTEETSDSANLRIMGLNFYQQNQIDIAITGQGKSPSWSVSNTSLLFTDSTIFETAEKTFTIQNTKDTALTIEELVLTGDSEFSILASDLSQLPLEIDANSSFVVHVSYSPVVTAAKMANISIVTDNELLPSLDISVSGNALAPVISVVDSTGNDFGNNIFFQKARIGETQYFEVQIKNTGDVNLTLADILMDPFNSPHFSISIDSTTIAPANNTKLMVYYQPQLPISINTAKVTFTTNDPETKAVELNLTGVSINPAITITPETSQESPYDFGEKTINPDSPYGPRTFIISNTGEGPLTIESIDFGGLVEPGFTIVLPVDELPFDIDNKSEGHESFTFEIYYNPTIAKNYAAQIDIISNDFNISTLSAFVIGSGSTCPPGFHGEDCSYECDFSEGGIEVCDGIDNDCDQQTDEDYPVNTPCEGVGECGAGRIECHPTDNQFTICSTDIGGSEYSDQEIGGTEEICDKLDNDCDGATDNGFDIGNECDPLGECGLGEIECHPSDPSQSICSTGPNGSMFDGSNEVCDNLDNNCDGTTDEGFTVGTSCEGVGECGEGLNECDPINTSLTICSTDIGGSAYPQETPPELCNNLDDDCDGLTDEGLELGSECQPEGECRAGIIECDSANSALPVCSTGPDGTEYDGTSEICDGKDNDCDGETDEDFNIGTSCPGIGECSEGTLECDPENNTLAICSTAIGGSEYPEPAPSEICNGLDDNCDGVTDENFGTGQVCVGLGECGEGLTECDPTDAAKTLCSTSFGGSSYTGSVETCDGLDNNCNGQTDEDWPGLGSDCTVSGDCGNGYLECNQHMDAFCTQETYCSKDPVCGSQKDGAIEVCNGIDDDCNSQTDEGFNIGSNCIAEGVCGSGSLECDPNNVLETICSTAPGGSADASSEEICDGLDNDCNSRTDESFNVDLACTALGECGEGTFECDPNNTSATICSTGPGGSESKVATEICDGKDNDCDGQTDEDFNTGTSCNGVGACGIGTIECKSIDTAICSTDIGGSEYVEKDEICNNIDDNCDGTTDENFNVGDVCDGVGECGEGTIQCRPGHPDETVCSTDPEGDNAEGQDELCDSKDNDCDGYTDEDFHINGICDGVGACGAGLFECDPEDNTRSICSSDIGGSGYTNTSESCNGLDDDCDSETDEDFELGASCAGVGICGKGVTECSALGAIQCSTHYNGSQWAGQAELCNGLDDDCDTRTDEDFDIGGLCAGQGVCPDGIFECHPTDSSLAICSTSFGASDWKGSDELCNGLDDDCDGVSDNGFGLGFVCNGLGECGEGTVECHPTDPTKSVCSTEPGGSQPGDSNEICDAKDNNCDGITDNNFGTGEECDPPGECGVGIVECADQLSTQCSTGPNGSQDQSVTEVCDGKDNNCDGQTDEGFELGGVCEGTGVCGLGVFECNVQGDVICSTEPGGTDYNQTGEEICNNRDDDCDGLTDEDLGLGTICNGIGECADDEGVLQCTRFGEIICSTSFGGDDYAGVDETCNNKDDNCDGATDETFSIGEDCDGMGECSGFTGSLICYTSTMTICSVNAFWHEDYLGQDERCNALDDDCNGETDETYGTLGLPCVGHGACGDGTYICNPNNDTAYICSSDEGGPDYSGTDEICDSIDNDCDTQTDEDWSIGTPCSGSGECSSALGEWVCNSTDSRICTTDLEGNGDYAGSPELCDYKDNDCDGLTDEDFTTVGQPCTVEGQGCGSGFIECNTNITANCPNLTYCSKDPDCGSQGGETPYEVCNGIDDNCDNCIDEGFTATLIQGVCTPTSCTGVGECSDGFLECLTFADTICSTSIGGTQYDGSTEICDGLDNDCDGLTDEDFLIGTQCEGIGECGPGLYECNPLDNTKAICSTDAGGSIDESLEVESCNNKDDDCDGSTDEDFEIGKSCLGEGECGPGVTECNEIGSTRCSTEWLGSAYQGSGEICNDLDDDCDGVTDEDFGITDPETQEFIPIYNPETGELNECAGNGACAFGTLECLNETTAICCSSPGGSCYEQQVEVCDGNDNDCNGTVDDPWVDSLGQPCTGAGVCGTGTWECTDDEQGIICSTSPGGSEAHGTSERCDGLDNDCDGYTDENFDVGNDFPCVGQGECGPGYFECDPADTNQYMTICSTDIGGSMYSNQSYPNLGGTPETCDSLDNDCDGVTDNGFHIGESCNGIGECRLGVYECDGSDNYRCSTNPGGSLFDGNDEICDGKDNDCDGLTDEDFNVGEDFPCVSPASCGVGVMECEADYTLRCSTSPGGSEYGGSEEICNGQDDDCDNSTDEDWEIGDTCCEVAGECGECGGPGRAGSWECATTSTRRCSVAYHGSISQSEVEICDFKDNDCDGQTDENFNIGEACIGTGACGSGVYECTEDEYRRCSSNPGGTHDKSSPELCDGIDNDCDGFTDEDFLYGVIADSCTSGNNCQTGYTCDVISRDCISNEKASCSSPGECGNGVLECATASETRCTTSPGGSAYEYIQEICDNKDNDCDGETDEDFYTTATCEGKGECGEGIWVCTDTTTATCSTEIPTSNDYGGSTEVCDSKDNDCDGQTDEDMNVGESCEGTGECGTGLTECAVDGSVICSTDPDGSTPGNVTELCDNLDNDCNGLTDETFLLGEVCNGNGDCGEGVYECDCPPGQDYCNVDTARCSTDEGGSDYQSSSEICDLRDNDCDGQTDEDWNIGANCVGVGRCGIYEGGQTRFGTLECKFGEADVRCSTDIGGSEYAGIVEKCNNIDDDCDGQTDEDFLTGTPCDGQGECGIGVYECNDEYSSICSTDDGGSEDEGVAETCNGLDDDCDGATDETFTTLGQTCTASGACGTGVWECNAQGQTICSAAEGGSDFGGQPERCNGLDDDCDGQTDETFKCDSANDPECDDQDYIGGQCDGVGECGIGTFVCDTDFSLKCDTDLGGDFYGGRPEKCDNKDNDCDGATDETYPLGEVCAGTGECGNFAGTWECNPLYGQTGQDETVCSTDPSGTNSQNIDEICNGLDDDCDGRTDNGFRCYTEDDPECNDYVYVGDDCQGTGGCGGTGKQECNADGSGLICSTSPGGSQFEQTEETLCDGLDNNCNGFTDEGFLYTMVDASCTQDEDCDAGFSCDTLSGFCISNTANTCPSIGECGPGTIECNPANLTDTICSTELGGSESEASNEICDGIDNDCDGETDEYWIDLGQPCVGKGTCGTGVWECSGIYSIACSVDIGGSEYTGLEESYPGTLAETMCDGLDNDCDGQTDEGLYLGKVCDGLGECGIGVIQCDPEDSSKTRCSTEEDGSYEVCDNRDNDCDGLTDEDFQCNTDTDPSCSNPPEGSAYLDIACTADGVCGTGVGECNSSGSGTRCSTEPGASQSPSTLEICDGLDNDCDGQTDEDFALGVVCSGIGSCVSGVTECAGDQQSVQCSTLPGGSEYVEKDELCNGEDDDCDGLVDEDYQNSNTSWPLCQGDGCGLSLGLQCEGIGACGTGTWECAADGEKTRCSVLAYEDGRGNGSQYNPLSEKCDNIDNDCDGLTDEIFDLDTPCTGNGICGTGVLECATNSTTRCSTEPGGSNDQSHFEICDDLDNDCDGETNEGFFLGTECAGVGECPNGIYECSGPFRSICSTEIGGSEYSGTPELCDDLDNDCDGETDETWSDKGEYCSLGQCGSGFYQCSEDGLSLTCVGEIISKDEVCNGLDDDCDGETDEDFNVGFGCTGVGMCGPGVFECDQTGEGTVCSSDISGSLYAGTLESCDNLDNDCDGETDEDFKDQTTGQYNQLHHCGQCNYSCIFDNAVAQCTDNGICEMVSCETNFSDINEDVTDGCECEDRYNSGQVCGEATSLPGGTLSDASNGDSSSARGQLTSLEEEMWFTFFAEDTEDSTCDQFNLYIKLDYNPENKFKMDVYRGNCDTLSCNNTLDYRMALDSNWPNGDDPATGECPCQLETMDGQTALNPNYCNDQSSYYYVRVYYDTPTVEKPTCETFVITASNGR